MQRLPRSLLLVSFLFILEGVVAAYHGAIHWSSGQVFVRFDIISIAIGVGLLRRRRGWRTFALVWLWLRLAVILVYLTWFVFSGRHAQVIGSVPTWLPDPDIVVAGSIAVECALALWSIGVLTSRPVISVFEDGPGG
jgi:hypothetical protein